MRDDSRSTCCPSFSRALLQLSVTRIGACDHDMYQVIRARVKKKSRHPMKKLRWAKVWVGCAGKTQHELMNCWPRFCFPP